MTRQTAAYTADIAERTVRITWPDNERGGATPPPADWQDRAWAQEPTLHEIDEGSVSGCSILRWRDDSRSDAELLAVSLALVTGKPAPSPGPEPAAVSAAVAPPTPDAPSHRAGLRDRIAAAIYERNNPGYQWADAHPDDRLAYGFDADAVLAVLPEPTDRAAVLREAIDVAREEGHRLEEEVGVEAARGARCVAYLLRKRLAKEQPLRRMADETATEQCECGCGQPGELVHGRRLAIPEPAAGARQDGDQS
ncbi:hypothetical protein ACWGNR_10095 [Streptomyces althioticus]